MLALLLAFPPQVALSKTPPSGSNTYYLSNRAPLRPSSFQKLPIGAITPGGWIELQVRLQADGYAGHLTEISRFLDKKNNAWLSPQGEGTHNWEEVPYWLRGYGDLGWVLHDPAIKKEAMIWLDAILSSQREDGYFGPRANLKASNGKPDVWPNMLALNALQSLYEATGDKRVIPFMTRYFRWQMDLPDGDLLTGYWEGVRAADNMGSIIWLYNITGDKFLLDLAEKFHKRSAPWSKGVANRHGVNFAQGFREPTAIGVIRNDPTLIAQSDKNYRTFRGEFGQVPGGMYGADENARKGKTDPRQAAETCAMVEMMWSSEWLLAQTGDPAWAERCEDIAFNSLPASQTADMKALRYLTSPNMPLADSRNKAPGFDNGGKMASYDPTDYRCCQHNTLFGWPYYAEHLWMATNGNGLAPLFYGPCDVTATVGSGATAHIAETTQYPFGENVAFKFSMSKADKFPVVLRIPTWCPKPAIFLNDQPMPLTGVGGYATINRTWKTGDVLELRLPMKVVTKTWAAQKGAVSVERGPLTYSLLIKEDYERSGGSAKWPGYEVKPASDWNFGLDLDGKFTVVKRPYRKAGQPFTIDGVPIQIQAKGRKIPEWQLDYQGLVSPLEQSPAKTVSPVETITLIPMGAARLRVTAFPTVSPKGTTWTVPKKANPIIPAKSSHVSFFDSTDALSDGFLPKASNDQEVPRFTFWDHKGTAEWVEYDFPAEKTFSQVQVYWFDDRGTGGCRVPESWKVQYLVGSEWKDAVPRGSYGVERNAMNTVDIEPIKAKSFRLAIKLQDKFSGGILEWVLR